MTLKLKPYVSLDLEFTSLNSEDSQILEIGAVYDDGVSDIKDLKTFNAIIYHSEFTKPQLEALVINANLLKQIKDIPKDDKTFHKLNPVLANFSLWLLSLRTVKPGTNDELERLTIAGKNVYKDIEILKLNCKAAGVDDISKQFTHRTIDVGSMYMDVFGENVTLGKINELTGRAAEVSHRALDDAFDVVHAVRHKLGMNK